MPDVFIEGQLLELFNGWVDMGKTPRYVIARQRLRLIAVSRVEYRQYKEAEAKQKEYERDAERRY